MNKRDYYEILGVSKSATKKEIKSAYRKLAKQYHPDRNKEAGAEDKFKEVQEAYDMLTDDNKRAAYDKYGHAGTQGFGGGAGFGGFEGGFGGFDQGDFGNMNDIFEQFFGGGFGGFSSSRQPHKSRGGDLEINLNLEFKEAVFGTEKTLSYKRQGQCKACNGTGAKNGETITCDTCKGQGRVTQVSRTFIGNIQTVTACPTCHGEGKTAKDKCQNCEGSGIEAMQEDFKVKIPQGIPDGVTLRFRNQGNAGRKGGDYGDLYINIEVQPHELLERRGDDIYTQLNIEVTEAVLGTQAQVETVHGAKTLVIPAGTQSEAVIRMSGHGAPKFKGTGNGDQYVKVVVKIPSKLTKTQRQLWEQLAQNDEKTGSGWFG